MNEMSEINVYPNPMYDYFVFERIKADGNFQLSLSDIAGKEIWPGNILVDQNSEVVDTSELLQGIYLLKVIEGGRLIQWSKILIRR